MLLIKTKIGQSGIHGFGLFADQFIPKGTTTWKYDPIFDSSFTQEEVDKLPEIAKSYFYFYAYFDKEINKYVLCSDSQRFINHSIKQLNITSTVKEDVAARDIQAGEELLCDYFKFDPEYFERHNINSRDIIE